MKKNISLFLVLVFIMSLVGCYGPKSGATKDSETRVSATAEHTEIPTQAPTESLADELFPKLTEGFTFTSGAGAWSTGLDINVDGTFSGKFHDSDMGANGPGYSNGTVYECVFSGRFDNVQKINDYTYSMEMVSIEYENEPDTVVIENEIKYIYSDAYGLANATIVYVYTPDAVFDDLPEGFRDWIGRLENLSDGDNLGFYGLYNVDEEYGFFSRNK